MTKNSRQLKKLITKLVEDSFSKEGEILEEKVSSHVKALKVLPPLLAAASLTEYLAQIRRELKKTTLEVESAVPLSGSDVEAIVKVLKTRHPILHTRLKLNTNLLGGIRMKIGDYVYDDSVQQKVIQIKEVIRG